MITAVIIDDEKKSIEILKKLINEINSKVNIVNHAQSVEEGFNLINREQPQLVFLDVEMLDGTGFNLLEKFTEINFQVIFITAYDQYAIKAFKYSAVDFLLKPIDIQELESAVQRASKLIEKETTSFDQIKALLNNINQENTVKKIALKSAAKYDFICSDELICILAEYNYSDLFLLGGKKITASQPLKHFEELFENNPNFFRVSRSCIISLNHIKAYHKNKEQIELINGTKVDLARRKKKEFLSLLKKEYQNL